MLLGLLGWEAAATRSEYVTRSLVWATLVVALAALAHYRWRRRRLLELAAKIPGPPGLPIVGNVFDVLGDSETTVKRAQEQFDTYQPTFRFWLGHQLLVALTDPRDLEMILGNNKYLDKSHFYRVFHPLGGQGVFSAASDKWRRNRKIIAPAFNFSFLIQFVSIFHAMAMRMVRKMESRADGRSFDAYKLVELCTLDAIAQTAMGVDVHAQDDDKHPWIQAIRASFKITRKRLLMPWLMNDYIFALTKDYRIQNEALRVVNSFAQSVITQKKQEYHDKKKSGAISSDTDDLGVKKRQTFLEHFIERSEGETGCALTDTEIRDEVVTLLIAGQDTTATENCFTLLLLAVHQEWQDAVIQELQDIMGDDPSTCPTYNDLNEMKILERVIKETLRLYPSAPFIGRDIEEEIELPSGYTLPAGCTVMLGLHGAHRLAEYWPDPEKFDPDRHLPDRIATRHPYAFVPFSGGPRNCLGLKYAMLQMKTILSTVLRHFHVYPGEQCESQEKFRLQVDFSMTVAGGHNIRLKPRKPKSAAATVRSL